MRFSLEQGVKNSAYIHHLNIILHELGNFYVNVINSFTYAFGDS